MAEPGTFRADAARQARRGRDLAGRKTFALGEKARANPITTTVIALVGLIAVAVISFIPGWNIVSGIGGIAFALIVIVALFMTRGTKVAPAPAPESAYSAYLRSYSRSR